MTNAHNDRLQQLRAYLAEAKKHPEDNKRYIEDLEASIKSMEHVEPMKPFNHHAWV